mmetsp:Transcript_119027/g.296984  ORF Transcript_119027/g.296984 Transcript_119027/m.296984 type:complete len:213 (+) Transcript_119027:143-781(+)
MDLLVLPTAPVLDAVRCWQQRVLFMLAEPRQVVLKVRQKARQHRMRPHRFRGDLHLAHRRLQKGVEMRHAEPVVQPVTLDAQVEEGGDGGPFHAAAAGAAEVVAAPGHEEGWGHDEGGAGLHLEVQGNGTWLHAEATVARAIHNLVAQPQLLCAPHGGLQGEEGLVGVLVAGIRRRKRNCQAPIRLTANLTAGARAAASMMHAAAVGGAVKR